MKNEKKFTGIISYITIGPLNKCKQSKPRDKIGQTDSTSQEGRLKYSSFTLIIELLKKFNQIIKTNFSVVKSVC